MLPLGGNIYIIQQNASAVGENGAGDQIKQSCFAGAVGANDGNKFARFNPKIEIGI